jgi:hypothetical protein
MFHDKYLSSSSLGSLKEDFLSFYYKNIGKINDPWCGANFDPRATTDGHGTKSDHKS